MKVDLHLNSQEEAIIKIVEVCSGLTLEKISGKSRRSNIAISRALLGCMLRKEGITSARAGQIVKRHHSSVLKYVKDHDQNKKYFPDYRDMYLAIQDEYITGYRAANIDVMAIQIAQLQKQITILKNNNNKSNINLKQKQWQKNSM